MWYIEQYADATWRIPSDVGDARCYEWRTKAQDDSLEEMPSTPFKWNYMEPEAVANRPDEMVGEVSIDNFCVRIDKYVS